MALPDGTALGRRLRERDLERGPEVLNLVENRSAAGPRADGEPAARGRPGRARRRGARPRRRRDRAAGRRASRRCCPSSCASGARAAAPSPCLPSTRPRGARGGSLLGDRARIAHDPADARHVHPLDRGRRPPRRPRRLDAQRRIALWPPRSTSSSWRRSASGRARRTSRRSPTRVAVVVQPGSGDVLQFLKSGIMEIPDVLVVTKADLGDIALRARRDLHAALRSIGRKETAVVAVSSLPPASGVDDLADALDAHRAAIDLRRAAPCRAARHRARGVRGRARRARACASSAAGVPRSGASPSSRLARTCRRSSPRSRSPRGEPPRRPAADAGRVRSRPERCVAELFGADNTGIAMTFGQIAFAATLVAILLRG